MIDAFAASLAVHVLVLAMPAGYPPHAAGPRNRGIVSADAPAPLEVRLGPYPLTAPTRSIPSGSQFDIFKESPIAPVLDDDGRSGGGSSPDERAGAATMLAPSPLVPGIPIPRYLEPKELTRRARILEDIEPSPVELEGRAGSGKIILVLFISESGKVDRVEVESSRLSEPFQSVISRQFQSARFAPAEQEGLPVKSRMRIEVVVRALAK